MKTLSTIKARVYAVLTAVSGKHIQDFDDVYVLFWDIVFGSIGAVRDFGHKAIELRDNFFTSEMYEECLSTKDEMAYDDINMNAFVLGANAARIH